MLIAVVIIVAALAVIAAAVVAPRVREQSRVRAGFARRRPVAAEDLEEEERRRARDRPREERVLIAEGQAIRAQVEARLAAEHPASAAYRAGRDGEAAQEIARQVEREQRERYFATYGAPVTSHAQEDGPLAPAGRRRTRFGIPVSDAVEVQDERPA